MASEVQKGLFSAIAAVFLTAMIGGGFVLIIFGSMELFMDIDNKSTQSMTIWEKIMEDPTLLVPPILGIAMVVGGFYLPHLLRKWTHPVYPD